jgi:hypothetical protein
LPQKDTGFSDEQQYRKKMHENDHSFSLIQEHRHEPGTEVEKEAAKLAELFGRSRNSGKGGATRKPPP